MYQNFKILMTHRKIAVLDITSCLSKYAASKFPTAYMDN